MRRRLRAIGIASVLLACLLAAAPIVAADDSARVAELSNVAATFNYDKVSWDRTPPANAEGVALRDYDADRELSRLRIYDEHAYVSHGGVRAPAGFRAAKGIPEGAARLTGANRAQIDPRKISDYVLNPSHPVGGSKARVFESAYGFNRSNADDLTAQLRKGVMEQQPIPGKVDQYGSRFTVDIPVAGPKGSGTVRTGWIFGPGSTTPRLTTAFPR